MKIAPDRETTTVWKGTTKNAYPYSLTWTYVTHIVLGGARKYKLNVHAIDADMVLGSVVVHPPCTREVPGSNSYQMKTLGTLVVTASLLGAQHDGIE